MRKFDYSVRTGRPMIEEISPKGIWQYFAEHPEEARRFNEGMTSKASADVANLIAAYGYSAFKSIVDVGGGKGHFIRAILAAHPAVRGVLLDLPNVVEGLSGDARLEIRGGDFFKDELPACDAYFLMNVIHDWDDKDSIAILKNVRRAARPGAKLQLAEIPLTDEPVLNAATMNNVYMMAFAAGRERTEAQYAALMSVAGWRLERVVKSQDDMAILEANPV